MADYNLGTLADEVIEDAKLDDTSRTRVKRYIKRAQEKILGHYRFSFNEDIISETLSIGSLPYDPDCDFQQIIQLTLYHSTLQEIKEPIYVPAEDFFRDFPLGRPDVVAGLPNYYTHYGGKVYFSRPLDKSYTLNLLYQASPSRLSEEEDQPDVPEEFSEVLYEGAMARVEKYRQNFDIAGVHNQTVEEISEDMLGRYGLRKRQPGKVRTSKRIKRDA